MINMGNDLDLELEGKYVILKNDWIYLDREKGITVKGKPYERVFLCEGGFGCSSFTSGTLIVGTLVSKNIKFGFRLGCIDRLATDEEIEKAKLLN